MSRERDDSPAGGRSDVHGRPPFLTWNALYAIVLGALALEIVAFSAMTLFYR
jgi:hypothetical protein